MAVNRDKPDLWKADIAKSVDLYNDWFMEFAPQTFRDTRILCGYFDSGYLGYEASDRIHWVWEHRIDDLSVFGL